MPTYLRYACNYALYKFDRYSLGDARYPNPESASLIEEITKQQMKDVVSRSTTTPIPRSAQSVMKNTLNGASNETLSWRNKI